MKAKFLRPRPSSKGLVFSMPMHYMPTSGVLLRDESGNGFTGTMTNGPTPRFPGFGFAATSSMYVDIGTGPTSVKTIALWTKPGGNRGIGGLGSQKVQNATLLDGGGGWTYGQDGGGDGWQESQVQANAADFCVSAWTGSEDLLATMLTAIVATKKYRVTAEFDALTMSGGTITLSVGGVDKTPANGANTWDITATSTAAFKVTVAGTNITTNIILDEVSVKEIFEPRLIDLNGTDFLSIDNSVLIKNGFTGTSVLYVDGVATATSISVNEWQLVGITNTTGKNATDLDIGRETAKYSNGLIAGVRLYDRVLTTIDFKNLYELTKWRYQK